MNWTVLIWILLYFGIGWMIIDTWNAIDNVWAAVVFIAWPLLIGWLILTIVGLIGVYILYGLLYVLVKIICEIFGGE